MTAIPLPITEERKAAYRHLLYVAMVDIRSRCGGFGGVSLSPWTWYQTYRNGAVSGAIADWLHNLARLSVDDFESFNEEEFWRGHARCIERFPGRRLERYRVIFDEYLAGEIYCC